MARPTTCKYENYPRLLNNFEEYLPLNKERLWFNFHGYIRGLEEERMALLEIKEFVSSNADYVDHLLPRLQVLKVSRL